MADVSLPTGADQLGGAQLQPCPVEVSIMCLLIADVREEETECSLSQMQMTQPPWGGGRAHLVFLQG